MNLLKKSLLSLATLLTALSPLVIFAPVHATTVSECQSIPDPTGRSECMKTAEPDPEPEGSGSSVTAGSYGSCRYFLGMTSWDCGLEEINSEATIKSGIWKIVLNIAIDLTVIASYLVLGYVIYGGYLYILSGGDASKVAAGKKALTHAFIGLAIVMSANIIMSSIRIALIGSSILGDCARSSCIDPGAMVVNAVQWVIGIAGLVAAIFVVIGGIQYITSTGDPGRIQTAKRTIIYALIGLAIVALAEVITGFVSSSIRDAGSASTSTIINNQQKEIYAPKIS